MGKPRQLRSPEVAWIRRACLVPLVCSALTAAEPAPRPSLIVDAPPGSTIDNGVGIYPNGFVARYDDLVLLGDALRWDIKREDVYAEGRVVLVRPGVRIHAERLGFHLREQSGEAWNVHAWIDSPNGRIPIHAEHVRMDRQQLVFGSVSTDRRHGGILAVGARSITVRLNQTIDPTRTDASRFVRDVAMSGPWFSLFNIPVFWFPYLYRDLSFDYPWTRVRFGDSSRLGEYIRFEIGTGLPEIAGVKTRIQGEVDHFNDAGTGFGAGLDWRHVRGGQGLAKWYAIEPEHVTDADGNSLGSHNKHVVDLEHRVMIPGGAISARWVEIPTPEPGEPTERFRSDYLHEDLATRPFARRGVTAAWGMSLGTLVVDSERAAVGDSLTTDRLFGLQARLADLQIAGPLHLVGDGWLEHLRDDTTDTDVTRITGTAALRALSWFGGIGTDASVGVRGILYADGTLAGVEQTDNPWQTVPYADAGVRLRFDRRFAGGIFNVITPRVGIEVLGDSHHDTLPAYQFQDDRDQLESDRRYLTTSLDTSVTRGRELFHADVLARWALREQDRDAVDDFGTTHTSSSAFAQLEAIATGRPTAKITLDAELLYDARLDDWDYFDTGARWDAFTRASLLYTGSYNPVPGVIDRWEHRPGVELRGNRYTLATTISTRPGGADIDGLSMQLDRRAVDAKVSLTFDFLRDDQGDVYDRRWGASITFP